MSEEIERAEDGGTDAGRGAGVAPSGAHAAVSEIGETGNVPYLLPRLAYRIWRVRVWVVSRPRFQELRRERYQRFIKLCRVQPSDRIVDIGSASSGTLAVFNRQNPITAVDLIVERNADALEGYPNVSFVQGDARRLPFADKAFDVAFCNSLIEHVEPQERRQVAHEIRRVADRYFVQTPNRWFPVEPHYLVPLWQFLPERLRRHYDRKHGEYIELLTAAELQRLLPEAELHRERVLGLTKSLMAVSR